MTKLSCGVYILVVEKGDIKSKSMWYLTLVPMHPGERGRLDWVCREYEQVTVKLK